MSSAASLLPKQEFYYEQVTIVKSENVRPLCFLQFQQS